MKKKQNLVLSNHISNLFLKKLKNNSSNKMISKKVESILKNIETEKDIFHSFSKKFQFNFYSNIISILFFYVFAK